MAFRNLRHYLEFLEGRGELLRVTAPVEARLEISEVADRVVKSGGPALLFQRVSGSGFPLAINLFGTPERTARALGVADLEEIARRIQELIRPDLPESAWDKLKTLPRLTKLGNYFPKTVKKAPCQEVVVKEGGPLALLPVLTCWPGDGGPFITLPLVFTRDPEDGRPNCGMYRMQVYDGSTTGMHWHHHKDSALHYRKYEARGERMPVSVALGGDPAVIYAATAPLPPGFDEMVFAGFLREDPVEMVRCLTNDLLVPAQSELVLEGYVDPGERRLEGPFGDHTGYYSAADQYPVFHLTALTHRQDAIYPATLVGVPPQEDCYLGRATTRIFLPLLRLQLPEIVDIDLPVEGVFHNCALVSIRKTYPGQARKVMSALWGLGQMSFTKLLVVVEEDVDVHDYSRVAHVVFNNIDPRRDLVFTEGPVDVLDHAAPQPLFGSKVGIDATRKTPEEGMPRPWPPEIRMSPEIRALVDRRWGEYGLPAATD